MVLIYAVVCRATDAVVLSEACDKDLKSSIGPAFLELLEHLRDQHLLVEGDRQTFVQKDEESTINAVVDDFLSHFMRSCSAALGDAEDNLTPGESADMDYYFHIFRRNDVYYGCLGDDARLPYQKVHFAFLEQVANEFSKRYWGSRIKSAKPYGMDSTFLPTLRSAMHYHNMNADTLKQDDKVKHLLAKTDSVQNLLGRNLKYVHTYFTGTQSALVGPPPAAAAVCQSSHETEN
jgi:Regulated-SNARE-like domain